MRRIVVESFLSPNTPPVGVTVLMRQIALSVAVAIAIAAGMTGCCRGDIIYSDNFTVDPAANGWTESVTGAGSGVIVSNGTSAIFDHTITVPGQVDYSIVQTFSTVGFADILLDFTAHQSSTSYEDSDFLAIDADYGFGFVTLLQNFEVWMGQDGTVNGLGTDGNTTPTSIATVTLDPAANNNGSLQIRIRGRNDNSAEDYFLDAFTLSGTAASVPEPSSFVLLAFGFLTAIRRLRHRSATVTLPAD
ncbi:MAG: PEP-CTERM sorting domain-containing protein [Planctomycetaceae bacterium]|nr:PEP-CTERM sorting domain-containing protein [Planctomycetaceae bacterium]